MVKMLISSSAESNLNACTHINDAINIYSAIKLLLPLSDYARFQHCASYLKTDQPLSLKISLISVTFTQRAKFANISASSALENRFAFIFETLFTLRHRYKLI